MTQVVQMSLFLLKDFFLSMVRDGLAKASQIGSVIKKCSKFVSFIRKSTIGADVLKDEKRLQADDVTPWNSQLKTIGSLLAIEERKLVEIKDAPKLTSHERLILHNIKNPHSIRGGKLVWFHQLGMFFPVLEDSNTICKILFPLLRQYTGRNRAHMLPFTHLDF